ncbi:hypothetical protein BKA65DRAFT_226679 [Rhexocercosporidium sp. MPI-PUGE-AT-0058]|nr:hypothetical protein BKA65DRAFT_226679 [Rhexocercosporidium sp. MPI-PUGE-AT-0058]
MLSAARNCLILAFLFASSCGGEQTGDARSSRQFLAKFPRQTATPGPSTPVPSPTTSTLSNPLSTYAPCIYYSSVLSSCENATTSFNQLNPAQQATCLCYTGSTSWAPASLYSAVVDCANVASNVAPSRYPYFSSLVDHCSSSRFVISSASLPLAGVSGVLTTANDTQTPAVTSSREPTAGISGSSTSGLFTRTSTTTSYSSRPTTNSSTSTGNTPGVAG